MPTRPRVRRATPADAEGIVAVIRAGFETYRDFAPRGWDPPPWPVQETRGRLETGDLWALVAEHAAAVVGVGRCNQALDGRDGPPIAGLAHVGALFVAEPWWGTGVATTLLAGVVEHMRDEGYGEARLFTPTGQARARAFYAREGWRETGTSDNRELGLELVELRRAL